MRKVTLFSAALLTLLPLQAASQTAQTAQTKTYRVLSEISYAPFIMRNEKGDVSGFEHDLLTEIAKRQGFKLSFTAHTWEGIFNALENKQADIISAGLTITEKRKQNMLFSEPYFESEQALLVSETSGIYSFNDLKNQKVSVKSGTTSDALLPDYQASPLYAETTWLTVKNVLRGDSAGSLGDIGPMRYYRNRYKQYRLRLIVDSNLPKEEYGFAVRKTDTELLRQINQGLAKVKADGTYNRIYRKYF